MIDLKEYNLVIKKLRAFFVARKFIEVPVQSRLSILAACEDPETIAHFKFNKTLWPLPQTGQMWLEYELLKNPDIPGVFCISTSYRDERHPIPGRHDKIFPMFEFESRGCIRDLINLEKKLLRNLGFKSTFKEFKYCDLAKNYGVEILEAEHETKMARQFGPTIFLTDFPFSSHPFWMMKRSGKDIFAKVDVVISGMETIGGAERSCDLQDMRKNFYRISKGGYAKKMFRLFGKNRVEKELNSYLSLSMAPRFGAGIGITRVIRAMKKQNILSNLI